MKSIFLFLTIFPFLVVGSEFAEQVFNSQSSLHSNLQTLKTLALTIQDQQSDIAEKQDQFNQIEQTIESVKGNLAVLSSSGSLTLDRAAVAIHDQSQVSYRTQILAQDIQVLKNKIKVLRRSLNRGRRILSERSQVMNYLQPDAHQVSRFFNYDFTSHVTDSITLEQSQLQLYEDNLQKAERVYQESFFEDNALLVAGMLQAQKDAFLLQWHQALKRKKDLQDEIVGMQASYDQVQQDYENLKKIHKNAVLIDADKKYKSHLKWFKIGNALKQKDVKKAKQLESDYQALLQAREQEFQERSEMHKESQRMYTLMEREKQLEIDRQKDLEIIKKSKLQRAEQEVRNRLKKIEQESQNAHDLNVRTILEARILENQAFLQAHGSVSPDVIRFQQRYQQFLLKKAQDDQECQKYEKELESDTDEEPKKLDQTISGILADLEFSLRKIYIEGDLCTLDLLSQSTLQDLQNIKNIVKKMNSDNERFCWYVSSAQRERLFGLHSEISRMCHMRSVEDIANEKLEKCEKLDKLQAALDKLKGLEIALKDKTDEKSKAQYISCVHKIQSLKDEIDSIKSLILSFDNSVKKIELFEKIKILFQEGTVLNDSYLNVSIRNDHYQDLSLLPKAQQKLEVIVDQIKKIKFHSSLIPSFFSLTQNQLKEILKIQGFADKHLDLLANYLMVKSMLNILINSKDLINQESLPYDIFETLKKEVFVQGSMLQYSRDQISIMAKIAVILMNANIIDAVGKSSSSRK